MKAFVFLIIVSLFLAGRPVHAENIYDLIVQGRLDEATDSLASVSSAQTRDGNELFYLSLIEKNGDQAAQLMEAALKVTVAASYRQEIYYRLAQYYLLSGNFKRAGELVTEYRVLWENGDYRPEMMRMSVLIDEQSQAYDAAIRQADRYLLENSEGKANQWGTIDKARVMIRYNKGIAAGKLLKKMSREKSGPAAAIALYMLAIDAIDRKDTDDAVFYYNLLREGYPSAVGVDAVLERLGSLSDTFDQSSAAEKLTGTYYSVQVGVFSVKENARKQADLFTQYGQKVEIKPKKIGDVKYQVVYVGRFSNYEEAEKFKTMLETKHQEVYQVVAQ